MKWIVIGTSILHSRMQCGPPAVSSFFPDEEDPDEQRWAKRMVKDELLERGMTRAYVLPRSIISGQRKASTVLSSAKRLHPVALWQICGRNE